jgi:hypothetical protein
MASGLGATTAPSSRSVPGGSRGSLGGRTFLDRLALEVRAGQAGRTASASALRAAGTGPAIRAGPSLTWGLGALRRLLRGRQKKRRRGPRSPRPRPGGADQSMRARRGAARASFHSAGSNSLPRRQPAAPASALPADSLPIEAQKSRTPPRSGGAAGRAPAVSAGLGAEAAHRAGTELGFSRDGRSGAGAAVLLTTIPLRPQMLGLRPGFRRKRSASPFPGEPATRPSPGLPPGNPKSATRPPSRMPPSGAWDVVQLATWAGKAKAGGAGSGRSSSQLASDPRPARLSVHSVDQVPLRHGRVDRRAPRSQAG